MCTRDLQKITNKTKVIMPTHYGGNGNMDEIYKIAKL